MIPSDKQPDLHEALLRWNTPNVVLIEFPIMATLWPHMPKNPALKPLVVSILNSMR